MAHKDRKTQKFRGSRTCGYGNTQKHRGAGSRGGRGMAGSKKHKWSFVSKYMPEHFGRVGFKRPLKVLRDENKINIGELNENLGKLVEKGIIELKNKKYIINLKQIGYEKLLGSGNVTNAMEITVEKSSKSAIEKVENAGGKVNLLTPFTKIAK